MSSRPVRLSAVVPTLHEAAALPRLLAALAAEVDEIVVSDGGSRDGTPALARERGAIVVEGPPGRGPQLDRGAAAATGDLLWFVHADTEIPAGAGAALRASPAEWGAFAVEIGSRDPRLRLTARWMTARARRTGCVTGDMAIWCRRPLYEALGGFGDLPALEDLAFADRARARAPWEVLIPPVTTSPRRWHRRGVWRTILLMWCLRAGFRAGLPPEWLARRYVSSP